MRRFLPPLLLLGGELLYMSLTNSDFETCIRRGLLLFLKDALNRKTNILVDEKHMKILTESNTNNLQKNRASIVCQKNQIYNDKSNDNNVELSEKSPGYRKQLLLLILSRWIIEYWATKTLIEKINILLCGAKKRKNYELIKRLNKKKIFWRKKNY